MVSTSTSAARARLQEDLKAGLNCIKELWQHEVKDWITCIHAADINLDGDIEVLAGSHSGRIYALDKDGILRWESIIGDKAWVTTIVACAPASEKPNVCAIAGTREGRIYALDQSGQTIAPPDSEEDGPAYWFDAHQSIIQMWLDPSQPFTITFAAEDSCVYCFDIASNRLRWSFFLGAPIHSLCTCDIDLDGLAETLVGSDNQMLYLLSSTGKLLNQCQMEQEIHALFAADIDNDQQIEILVGTRTKKLFALDSAFHEKWVQPLSNRPLAIEVVDVNNDNQPEILVTCDDQSFSILDNAGNLIWRNKLGKRYHCLNTSDLDRDGHIEVLAGTDNSKVQALRIQLSKDLDKRIRRSYANLGKPEVTTLTDLSNEQLNLLEGLLGTNYGAIDKKLSLTSTQMLMEAGEYTTALLSVLKLNRQRFQLLWEKGKLGYRRALCLADLAGDKRREVVVSSQNGGLSVFNANGRLLWSEKSPDGNQIFDAQSGYLFPGHGEDLAFASASGILSIINSEKARSTTALRFPEEVSSFYILAPGNQIASDILIGTKSGKAHLYTNNFEKAARVFEMPTAVQRVYASEPDESGKYRNPQLLISTAENVLFAYTRGGNCLWTYATRSRILALCVKDLDGDGRLEVLIGSEDRNIYVLDDNGNLRWRYVLYNTVLALETADIDGDGQQEILAGCGDGILYIFTSIGDLIWRYPSRDPIQALRAADIDLDSNFEIVMVEESHLEVLQVIKQQKLDELMNECWAHLLADRDPLDALLPLIKGNDPDLRAAALVKLASLNPLPPKAFDLFNDAVNDAFAEVRKVLPEALMHVYQVNPPRARTLLNTLFTERVRDIRIEVVEHLEVLAKYDWNTVLSYLERALRSIERNTRRAALRKISHLLREFADEIKHSQHSLGESLFKLLIYGAKDAVSLWVKEESGRVLADFLNLFEGDFLFYLLRMFSSQLGYEALQHTAFNLASPKIQQVVLGLLTLKFDIRRTDAEAMLAKTVRALEIIKEPFYNYSTDLWLIFSELHSAFSLFNIEKLSLYDFQLKPEQFQMTETPYPHAHSFLRIGENLTSITHPLKAFLRRTDPNDRLNILLESIVALETFQRSLDREYGVSPLPNDPQPYLPEFAVLKALVAHWQELFNAQRNELRGHPELQCDLQRTVHQEETVGTWLQIANHGRASARQVKVTLLSDNSFTTDQPAQPQIVVIDNIQPNQDAGAEFLLKPLTETVTLTFEVAYVDMEHELHTLLYQERLDFIEHPQSFTPIETPYTTGTPLHDNRMCYGREAPLAYLYDNLARTTTQTVLVLYGQRRSGKTTLLNQLAETDLLAQHVTVMIDMQSLVYEFELNKFFFKVSHRIYKAMRKKGLTASEPSRQDFFDLSPSADPLFAFELFLDKIEMFLEGRRLILLLDEFEELETLVKQGSLKPEIFKYLRSLMQERPYIHFLLSGTQQIEKLTRSYWSVFFNIALHHRLTSNISPEGAIDLITRPVAGLLEYEPQVVNKIRGLTADQPYMIHLVCRALVDHCNKEKKNYATLNDVNLVLQDVLTTGTVHFGWLWDRFGKTEQLLLQVIAEGTKDEGRLLDLDDIKRILAHFQYPYQVDTLIKSLNILWEEDVISKEQQKNVSEAARYALVNGLLRQWLKQNKPLIAYKTNTEQPVSAVQEQTVPPIQEQSNGASTILPDPLSIYSPGIL